MIGKLCSKIDAQISKLFSWLMFCSINKFLKYVKGLSFGFLRFSIISSCCTISDTKIELIVSLCYKIKTAKIAMQVFKVLRRLWYRLINSFLYYLLFIQLPYISHRIGPFISMLSATLCSQRTFWYLKSSICQCQVWINTGIIALMIFWSKMLFG